MTSKAPKLVADRGHDGSGFDEVVALVDKSLVQFDDATNRYRLLESVRDYAAEKLLARSQSASHSGAAAHRDYYLELAETAAPHLIGHGQSESLDRLQLELDNLRAAIAASLRILIPTGSASRQGPALFLAVPRAEG